MLKDIVAVKPLAGSQLWLTFEDGIESADREREAMNDPAPQV